jgi:hypothetical protein
MAVNVGGIQPILTINCQLSRDSSCSALKAVEWRQRWRERATDSKVHNAPFLGAFSVLAFKLPVL